MAGYNKIGEVEKQKRIYQVGLMLRRKPRPYILRYIKENWHLETSQADNYIREAKEEWKKYFKSLKAAGMSYHITQMRDLKDQALNERDTKLAFDISKEEAKLMGTYPATKVDFEDVLVKFELITADKETDKEEDKEDKEKNE